MEISTVEQQITRGKIRAHNNLGSVINIARHLRSSAWVVSALAGKSDWLKAVNFV
jgi:hypothetical protein